MPLITLTSSNLSLRLVQQFDLQNIHELLSFPEVDQYNTLGIPKNLEETQQILQIHLNDLQKKPIKSYTFTVEQNTDNQFIGLIAINLGSTKFKSAEIWYKLRPDFWGKGFATEAVKAILDFGFNTLKLHRIEAGCAVENIGSIKVLEKVGMTREGGKRKALPLKTGWADNFEYAILAEEFIA